MNNNSFSILEKWRAEYGASLVALGCLYTTLTNWGNNWFWTGISALGLIICGMMGIFDVKRALKAKDEIIKNLSFPISLHADYS